MSFLLIIIYGKANLWYNQILYYYDYTLERHIRDISVTSPEVWKIKPWAIKVAHLLLICHLQIKLEVSSLLNLWHNTCLTRDDTHSKPRKALTFILMRPRGCFIILSVLSTADSCQQSSDNRPAPARSHHDSWGVKPVTRANLALRSLRALLNILKH